MRPANLIVLASLNKGKEEEFRALFHRHKLKVANFDSYIRNASFLEHVESRAADATYHQNAHDKCLAVFRAAKLPTLADDSGLEIDALQGEPGVHSAHFAKPAANQSQSQANRKKVLDALKGKSDRRARMRSVLILMVEGLVLEAEGVCEGKIADSEKGSGGFGYDSIFIPDAAGGKTFAELSDEEKNNISHRALAVEQLVKLMHERDLQLVRP